MSKNPCYIELKENLVTKKKNTTKKLTISFYTTAVPYVYKVLLYQQKTLIYRVERARSDKEYN